MDNTLGAVLELTEQLTDRGMYNTNTGGARATALRKFMEVVPGLAEKDIHELVIEDIVRQYGHLRPGEKWLNIYATRIKSAIRDFKEYKNNPAGFRPRTKRSAKQIVGKSKELPVIESRSTTLINPPETLANIPDFKSPKTHSTIRLHLRPEIEVAISGIPLDFNATECKQLQALLGAFVKTAFEDKNA